MEFTFWDILRNLLLATRWTITLSIAGFMCGGATGLLLMVLRIARNSAIRTGARLYIELFQGTPLLLQLFLVFFGLPLIGVNVRPWLAAGVGLTLSASAFLAEIWRGCVEALPPGQWDAAAALGLHRRHQLQLVILPQALRIAVPPTVGFLVQLVKSTALTSIIGLTNCWYRKRDHQRDVRAVRGVWRRGPDLLCALFSADFGCPMVGASVVAVNRLTRDGTNAETSSGLGTGSRR